MFNFNFFEDILLKRSPDQNVLFIILLSLLCVVTGYLIGSINSSIIISKLFYKDDIRTHGSGNAGSTNMLRTHGTASGLLTLLFDALKTAAAVILGALIFGLPGEYIAGFFCIIGHIYPVFFKFKGGKGVVTVAVTMALTNVTTFLICLGIFLIVVIISKYVSLGSMVAVVAYPFVLFAMLKLFNAPCIEYYIGIPAAVLIAALVVFKHRSNIRKLIDHRESKLSFTKHGTDGDKK